MKVIDTNGPITDPVFALIYGSSGSGKTAISGTLGEVGKVLIIDIDRGSKTIKTSKRVAPFLKNITVVSFDAFKDLDTTYKTILTGAWDKVGLKGPYDWIVWDSWSELQWNMMQQLRENSGLLKTSLEFRKNIEIQHWGMLTDLNKLSIESLREAGVKSNTNQVFIMLETMSKDDLSGAILGGPAIHGKMVQEMPGYFDVVVHTYNDLSGKYWATTKPKAKWVAKTRLGEAKDLENPTAKVLFDLG